MVFCSCTVKLPAHLARLADNRFRHVCSCGIRYRVEGGSFVPDGVERNPFAEYDARTRSVAAAWRAVAGRGKVAEEMSERVSGHDDREADRAERSALAARIRWALGRSGITMAAAERAAGLGAGTVGHITSGRRPGARIGVSRARLLAAALRVSAAWLLLGDGPAYWRVRLWQVGSKVMLGAEGRYLGMDGRSADRAGAGSWAERCQARYAAERAGASRQRGDEGALPWAVPLVVIGVVPRSAKHDGEKTRHGRSGDLGR